MSQEQKYGGIWTKKGIEKLASFINGGNPIHITESAFGDGNGTIPIPDTATTSLAHEVWRGKVTSITQKEGEHSQSVIVEVVIPYNVGGFFIREWGLYDTDGDLVVYGNHAEFYKALLIEGTGAELRELVELPISSKGQVQITVSYESLASVDYVNTKLQTELTKHNKDENAHKPLLDKIKGLITSAGQSMQTHLTDPNAHKGLFDSIKNNFNDFASKTKDNVFTGLNLIQHRELRFKNPTLDIFNPPASGRPSDVNSFRFFDKRNIMIGELVYLNSSDGRRHLQITNTYKKHINPETGENTQGRYLAARLGITVDADDRPYGEAPTPLPTQIGNYIATTKWVQDNVINKGYLLKKIAERTTNGDWTIPKVVIGKPLKIYSILGVGNNNVANISVKSGADTGKGTYALGNEYSPLWLYKSTNIFEIIPTSTTVILSVSASTSNKLVAYQ